MNIRLGWNTCGVALALGAAAATASAALAVGDAAPDFRVAAALAGNEYSLSLTEALQKGPVVLYFYPKPFTSGCTAEAHAFAEATPKFAALGTSVVGMSVDDIGTLKKFSVEACRDKFAVGADVGGGVTKLYDAASAGASDRAARISYVISPAGRVIYVYASANPDEHVQRTMAAVEQWKREHAP
jgi:peroxiredoxin